MSDADAGASARTGGLGGPARIGFVGVGNQGGPIAMRIVRAGLPLTVWTRRPEAARPFVDAGATAAGSLAELGATCPMVAVCVTTDDDVVQVTTGPGGVLGSMGPGSTLAIHSTVHPDTVVAIAAAGEAIGVAVLDAPVSGGAVAAEAGTMAVLVGGAAEVLDRWRPSMATWAAVVERLGDVGAGQRMKLVNNAAAAMTLEAGLRALAAADELGLDREAAFRIMAASSADSFMLRAAALAPAEGLARAARLFDKDVALLADLAEAAQGHGLADAARRSVSHIAARAEPDG